MSFISITDPKKRDETVKAFLATRKRIQQRNINEKLGDMAQSEDRQKMFEPIIQSNLKAGDLITKELIPIKNELKELTDIFENQLDPLPALPPLPSIPRLRRQSLPSTPTTQSYSTIAIDHLRQALSNKSKHDNIFGVYNEDNNLKIGNKVINIDGSNIKIAGKSYQGTEGLWTLLTMKEPGKYTPDDLNNYKNILLDTDAMYQNNDPTADKPKSSRASKWLNIIKPIWHDLKAKTSNVSSLKKSFDGNGVVYLSQDPCELVTRLNLLISEYRAGNLTVRNEIVAITDLLKKKSIISNAQYKTLNGSLF